MPPANKKTLTIYVTAAERALLTRAAAKKRTSVNAVLMGVVGPLLRRLAKGEGKRCG